MQERLKIPSKFQSYDHSSDEDEDEAEKWEVQYLNSKKSEAISKAICELYLHHHFHCLK